MRSVKETSELITWLDGGDCPKWLIEWAKKYFGDEIPYSHITGDEGSVETWLSDHIDIVQDRFKPEIEAFTYDPGFHRDFDAERKDD